jgi:NADPH:quinone reductase-like Zn-dependent oxidoreductase
MKAIVHRVYGPPEVLELRDVDEPDIDEDGVLVRVLAASVNAADWHYLRGVPYIARLSFGLREPKHPVLGCDLAGRVEAVGENVTTVQPGDEVFGSPFEHGLGAFAELCALPSEDLLERKPADLSFEQAAAVPLAGMTALQALRDHGRIEAGQRVLIIGASGGVGTFAVQIAKAFGAEVTGVCSTGKLDLVRSLGADQVIDYTQEDFADGRQPYDLILQAAGTHSPSECRRALTQKGTLVAISGDSEGRWIGPFDRFVKAQLLSPLVGQRMVSFTMSPSRDDLRALSEMVVGGAVRPVIDRTYSLSETPDAIAYLEGGRARGKVVVIMAT